MGVDSLRQKLLERIQAGDDQFIRVMSAVSDALCASEDYAASLHPMTVEELVSRSRASDEDIAAGRLYDLEEVMKELAG